MGDAEEIKTVIREWIGLDDQARELQKQQKVLREQKLLLSQKILEFMRENQVDNFNLEGGSSGTIARSVRQTKPPLKRQIVRTQLLLQFADQPQRVAEVLRAIDYNANSDDFIFDNQVIAQIFEKGFEIAEITCPTKYFSEASSINLSRSIKYGIGVLGVSFKYWVKRITN